MEQEILQLATQCPLPMPVERQAKGAARDDSTDKENFTAQQAPKPKRAEAPIAPYQALPVTLETVITHNFTPARPVIEQNELTSEVRVPALGALPELGSLITT
jgi:hypothetical protein